MLEFHGQDKLRNLLALATSLFFFSIGMYGSEINKAFKALELKGVISDNSYLQSYATWRPSEKDATSEKATVYDADGNPHEFVLYKMKDDSRYSELPAVFSIGERRYISLVSALASAKPGDIVEISPGGFTLPPVHVAPRLESSEFFHRLTSLWTSDDYIEFYFVPKETWVDFGPFNGITIRGTGGGRWPLEAIASAQQKSIRRARGEKESQGADADLQKNEGKKKGLLRGIRDGLGKLNLKDVQEGSILGLLQGGGSYPTLKHVLARGDAYMLPKVDYLPDDKPILINRPGAHFRRLGWSYQGNPGWALSEDYPVANPFVISDSKDLTIEGIDFSGLEIGSYDSGGNGSGVTHFGPMVAVMDSERITFKHCIFANSSQVAVLLERSKDVVFDDCVFLHGAEEAIRVSNSEMSVTNSLFLGNGRGKAIKHRVITGDVPGGGGKMIQTTVEEFPRSKAIQIQRSFADISRSLFKYSGTGAIEADCGSGVVLTKSAFDEAGGVALELSGDDSSINRVEGNIVRGDIVCGSGNELKCANFRSGIIEKNTIAAEVMKPEDIVKLLTSDQVVDSQSMVNDYRGKVFGIRKDCAAASGSWISRYLVQMAFACRSGWKGITPDLSYFDLGAEEDRSALALGFSVCGGLSKALSESAKAAREIRSAGYTSSLRIILFKEGVLFKKPIHDFPLELLSEGQPIAKFSSGRSGLFSDGAGTATITFLRPGHYEIRSPLLSSTTAVDLKEGLTGEVFLELK